MDLGFETIGNACIICHDRGPVLATDPWLFGPAYFGSWILSHEVPNEQFENVKRCKFVWISHGHPDHLSLPSLELLQDKQILLADHYGGR
ncbi:MAG TPA: MBL fold metallo-hydrolase, partial [Planctomycetota bacterium]|nr:MBL fold metallo-hydrolase [Planctomycetota bacterium]